MCTHSAAYGDENIKKERIKQRHGAEESNGRSKDRLDEDEARS